MRATEKLLHATTLITETLGNGDKRFGTGFFVRLQSRERQELVIVTNKHVVSDAVQLDLAITIKNAEGTITNRKQMISILGQKWIPHPDAEVDLCCSKITDLKTIAEQKDRVEWVIAPFAKDQIVPKEGLSAFAPADEVYMIGYPDGLRDPYNNQPLFRRGILSVDPKLNYGGREIFVVDIPVYPGSSGSPIVSIGNGLRMEGETLCYTPHNEGAVKLLGVNFAAFTHAIVGKIRAIPVGMLLQAESELPNNLALSVKAYKILDFEPLLG